MQNLVLGELGKLVIHFVGNKTNGEGIRLSNNVTQFDRVKVYIEQLITKNFKSEEFYCFYFLPSLHLNPMYEFVGSIFENNSSLIEQSLNIARILYDKSTHPQIKAGELCISYFKECELFGEKTDCIGIFKSENKETILKVSPVNDGFELNDEKGINTNKLDKGCLIFNTDKENGYIVAVVDNTNKGTEAKYWTDDFLHVKPRNDEYSNTKNVLSMAKNFVLNELPQHFEVSKADQVDLLNKSVEYFKKNESFDMETFAQEVMGQKKMIESFNTYKSEYEFACELAVLDRFAISEAAVKKQAKSLKSVIKLDKNFHIYVHGDRDLIEQGEDEEGRKFYKIYYNKES
jgi:hypothetical protein